MSSECVRQRLLSLTALVEILDDFCDELPVVEYQNALKDYWRIAALESDKKRDLFIPDY